MSKQAVEMVDDVVEVAGELVDETVLSQELAVREEREHLVPATTVLPSAGEWEATMTMAKTIAATTFVPKSYRGNPEAVVAGILYGREIGLGPMQALQQIHIIDGKPSMSAELMLAQMRRGGVVIVESRVDDQGAFIHARRKDTGEEAEVEWTVQEAADAGLTGKDNWAKYRQDMLWARVVGRLARRLGSDLLGGMVYATEEMQDWDGGGYGGDGYATQAREVPVGSINDWRNPRFDPGVSLDKNAPKGWEEIGALALELDHLLMEWIAQAVVAKYGSSVKDIASDKDRSEAGKRIANTLARVRDDLFADGDFPPPADDDYRKAFAWGFGVDIEGPGVDGVFDVVVAEAVQADTGGQESATDAEPVQDSLLGAEKGVQHRDPTAEDPT